MDWERKIKSSKKERTISGILYLTVLIPMIAFLTIPYVSFFYGKNSKFMKFHANQAGVLWFFHLFIIILVLLTENPQSILVDISNPILVLSNFFLRIVTVLFAIITFTGKSYRISALFDFLKK